MLVSRNRIRRGKANEQGEYVVTYGEGVGEEQRSNVPFIG